MTISNVLGFMMLSVGLAGACSRSDSTDDGTVLTPYLAIGDKLAGDSVEGLPELAAQVTAAAKSDAEAPGMDHVVAGAARVGAADLATARGAFKEMSEGLVEQLRADPKRREGYMLVHCPMTFDGGGAVWVQERGKVENPYEGSRMPTCGDVLDWDDPPPKP
jgi:hypothetical protein